MSGLKAIIFLIICFGSASAFSQSCDCPPASSCAPCVGGLTSLTLRFNGAVSGIITASDQIGVVFNNTVSPGQTFSFTGSIQNDKFAGPSVDLTVNGVNNTTISSNCAGSAFIGSSSGSFTVVAASSKNGGSICCQPADVDNQVPVISNCPGTIIQSLSGTCKSIVNWTPPTAGDNCAVVSFTSSHNPGDEFDAGTTQVTYTATDAYGNVSTCTFNVVVNDNTLPVFTACPANITVPAGANCRATATWADPSATDNCGVAGIVRNRAPGTEFDIGQTLVTYTATDIHGKTAVCSFTVTVAYAELPEVSGCPGNLSGVADATDQSTITWSEPVFTTRCGGALAIQKSHEPGSRFSVGSTEVTYTATDESGNTAQCRFLVQVELPKLEIEISKLLTPDGDGFNDYWKITNLENYPDNRVTVFDRWGSVLYKSSHYDNQSVVWNGTNKDNNPLPTGTYFYVLEITYGRQKVKREGFIELVR